MYSLFFLPLFRVWENGCREAPANGCRPETRPDLHQEIKSCSLNIFIYRRGLTDTSTPPPLPFNHPTSSNFIKQFFFYTARSALLNNSYPNNDFSTILRGCYFGESAKCIESDIEGSTLFIILCCWWWCYFGESAEFIELGIGSCKIPPSLLWFCPCAS